MNKLDLLNGVGRDAHLVIRRTWVRSRPRYGMLSSTVYTYVFEDLTTRIVGIYLFLFTYTYIVAIAAYCWDKRTL
jgi:hypothetical protein